MAKEDRGFASMDRAKQREIASKGGKAAHQKGTAHEWTSEEARVRCAAPSQCQVRHRRRWTMCGTIIHSATAGRAKSKSPVSMSVCWMLAGAVSRV